MSPPNDNDTSLPDPNGSPIVFLPLHDVEQLARRRTNARLLQDGIAFFSPPQPTHRHHLTHNITPRTPGIHVAPTTTTSNLQTPHTAPRPQQPSSSLPPHTPMNLTLAPYTAPASVSTMQHVVAVSPPHRTITTPIQPPLTARRAGTPTVFLYRDVMQRSSSNQISILPHSSSPSKVIIAKRPRSSHISSQQQTTTITTANYSNNQNHNNNNSDVDENDEDDDYDDDDEDDDDEEEEGTSRRLRRKCIVRSAHVDRHTGEEIGSIRAPTLVSPLRSRATRPILKTTSQLPRFSPSSSPTHSSHVTSTSTVITTLPAPRPPLRRCLTDVFLEQHRPQHGVRSLERATTAITLGELQAFGQQQQQQQTRKESCIGTLRHWSSRNVLPSPLVPTENNISMIRVGSVDTNNDLKNSTSQIQLLSTTNTTTVLGERENFYDLFKFTHNHQQQQHPRQNPPSPLKTPRSM